MRRPYAAWAGCVNIHDTVMSHEKPRRRYELRKRAEQVAETHRRITDAAIELHGTVGPARTTLSAVAERAGVERRTLYRHFPDEAELFEACSTAYFAANPWPDLDAWRAIRDPGERLAHGLDELYAYYERTAPMFANVLRDAELVAFARDAVAPLEAYLRDAVSERHVGNASACRSAATSSSRRLPRRPRPAARSSAASRRYASSGATASRANSTSSASRRTFANIGAVRS